MRNTLELDSADLPWTRAPRVVLGLSLEGERDWIHATSEVGPIDWLAVSGDVAPACLVPSAAPQAKRANGPLP